MASGQASPPIYNNFDRPESDLERPSNGDSMDALKLSTNIGRCEFHSPPRKDATTVQPITCEEVQRSPRAQHSWISPMLGVLRPFLNRDPFPTMIYYSFKVIYPRLLCSDDACRQWFFLFCEYPIIFHSFHYAYAVHRDVMEGIVSLSASPKFLKHKYETIRILKNSLSSRDLGMEKVEVLLLTVLLMATNELAPAALDERTTCSLQPHWPEANWLKVYGQMKPAEIHVRAMRILVEHVGGLASLSLSPLASIIALSDLVHSSQLATSPFFPCYWTSHREMYVKSSSRLSINGHPPGKGFFTGIPGGLPSRSLATFVRLACINRLMSSRGELEFCETDRKAILDSRNTVQHDLLSLPAWENIEDDERNGVTRVMYECCRRTAILYSNAVIMGLPTQLGWNANHSHGLRAVFEASELDKLLVCAPGLTLWSACVGALASVDRYTRAFFEQRVERVLVQQGRASSKEIEQVLDSFLWSRQTCEAGLKALVTSLEMNKSEFQV